MAKPNWAFGWFLVEPFHIDQLDPIFETMISTSNIRKNIVVSENLAVYTNITHFHVQ